MLGGVRKPVNLEAGPWGETANGSTLTRVETHRIFATDFRLLTL